MMDSSKAERGRGPASDQNPGSNPELEEPQRTPVRPSRGTKRKLPGTTPTSSKTDDLERPGSSKKRRKSTSGPPLTRVGSPGSLLKPAMTERQQMALLKQMTSTEMQKSPASDPTEETPPRLEVTPKSRFQRRNERGETPLHVACIRGDLGTAFTLIAQGAEVNATDHAGWTPLHEACNHGYVKLVVLLLKNGAAKNIRGMDGDTPLHDAAVNNHLEVVTTLLEHGADPNVPNDKGHTPMDVCKDVEILRALKGEVEEREGGAMTGNGTEVAMETGALSDAKDQKVRVGKRLGEQGHDSMESKPERHEIMETMPVSSTCTKSGTDTGSADQTSYRTESEPELLPLSHSESSSLENLPESTKKTTTGKPSRGPVKARAGFYSDISSSESDSDYFELASRKSRRKGKPMHFVRKLEEVRESLEAGEEASVAAEGRVEGDEGLDRSKEQQPQVVERSKSDGGPEGTLNETGTKSKAKDDESTEQKRDPDDGVHLQSSLTAPAQTRDQSPEENGSEKTSMSAAHGNQVAASTEGMSTQQHPVDAPLPKLPVKLPEKEDSDAEIDVDTTSSTPTTDGEVFHMSTSPVSGSVESAGLIVSVPLSLIKLSVSKQDTKGAKADQGAEEERRGLETQMDVNQTPEIRVPDDAAGSSQAKSKPSKEETASGLYSERLSHGKIDASEVAKEAATAGKVVASDEPHSAQDSHLPTIASRQSKDATSTPSFAVTSTPVEREKHTKHGRKPQHVFSSKKLFRETKRESEAPSQLECGETIQSLTEKPRDSSGFSWGGLVLPSHPPKGSDSRQGTSERDSDTSSATPVGGRGGGDAKDSVQVRRVKEEDMSGQVLKQKSSDYDLEFDDDEDSDFSKSAIVSLSTSLPIVFSRHTAGLQQQQPQQKSAPTVLTMKQEVASSIPKDVLTTPPNFKPHTLPILLEAMKSLSASQKKSGQSGTTGAVREISQEAEDIHVRLSLPPKKRYRGVQRSAVVQQRREKHGPPPTLPSQFDSFLTCTRDYQSKRPLQPTSPKSVYPPIHSSLYKLFSEQEGERVRLTAAHLAEQDRLLLSMEQELVRAHQRATKCHTPISVCSVLLERLLPAPLEQVEVTRGEKMADVGKPDAPNTATKYKGSFPTYPLDERLLSALVQDVWDKFHELQSSLLSRQRHEAEALWLLQRDQWTDRLTDLGLPKATTSRHDLPSAHVPLVASLTRQFS